MLLNVFHVVSLLGGLLQFQFCFVKNDHVIIKDALTAVLIAVQASLLIWGMHNLASKPLGAQRRSKEKEIRRQPLTFDLISIGARRKGLHR